MIHKNNDGSKYFYKDGGTYLSDIMLDPYCSDGPYIEANSEYYFDLTIEELKEIRDLIDEFLSMRGYEI